MSDTTTTLEREVLPRAPSARQRLSALLGWAVAALVAAVFVLMFLRFADLTQGELRLTPWLRYDERVDFNYFYGAATMVRHGEAHDLYPDRGELTFYQGDPAFAVVQDEYTLARMIARGNYYNPPTLAYILSPLAALSFRDAFWFFTALSISALGAFLLLAWRTGRPVPEMALFTLGVLSFRPVHEAVIMGHMSLFFLLALAAGFLLLRSDRPLLAGVVLATLFLKPQWALAPAGMLFFLGQWRALGTMVALGAALFFVPFFFTGFDAMADYYHFLRAAQRLDLQDAPHMFSWNGFFYKLDAAPNSPWLVYGFALATIVPLLIVWRGGDFYLAAAATLLAMLLVSTRSVWYDWALVAAAALFLIARPSTNAVRYQAWAVLIALHLAAAQSTAALLHPGHHFIDWHRPAFYSLTWVTFGAVLWLAGLTVQESRLRLPRLLRRRTPAPARL